VGVERNDSPPNAINAALWSAFRIMKGNESVGELVGLVVPGIARSWSARACLVLVCQGLLGPGLPGLALSLIGIVRITTL
jgi:hypothetical protein